MGRILGRELSFNMWASRFIDFCVETLLTWNYYNKKGEKQAYYFVYSFAYLKCACVFVSANTDKIASCTFWFILMMEEQKLPTSAAALALLQCNCDSMGGHGAEGLLPSGYQVISLGVLWSYKFSKFSWPCHSAVFWLECGENQLWLEIWTRMSFSNRVLVIACYWTCPLLVGDRSPQRLYNGCERKQVSSSMSHSGAGKVSEYKAKPCFDRMLYYLKIISIY